MDSLSGEINGCMVVALKTITQLWLNNNWSHQELYCAVILQHKTLQPNTGSVLLQILDICLVLHIVQNMSN